MTCHRTLIRLSRYALAALLLTASGCDLLDSNTPRRAWEETMQVRLKRDYAALYDSLASVSKQEMERVLTQVKRDPRSLESMHQKLQLPTAEIEHMGGKQFFLALMTGVERKLPGVVNLQLQNARGAEFVREAIKDDRAVGYWKSGTGKQEETLFLRENGQWKPILQRN